EKGKAFEFYPQALCYLPLRAFSFKMNNEGLTPNAFCPLEKTKFVYSQSCHRSMSAPLLQMCY
ncbi:MAG: hypothetical protein AABZ54_02515, partial [Bacteroidota bacterium]